MENNMNNHIESLNYSHSHYLIMDNINNSKLHLYLRIDKRYKYKSDVQVNTGQREQYGVTVHLLIGTGHSLCKIKSMPLIFTLT